MLETYETKTRCNFELFLADHEDSPENPFNNNNAVYGLSVTEDFRQIREEYT